MNIILVSHAVTEANLTGSLVRNYDEQPIIEPDWDLWYDKVGKFIYHINTIRDTPTVFYNKTKRTYQTALGINAVFAKPDNGYKRTALCRSDYTEEFDCSALGEKKFWELSEKNFEDLVTLKSSDMHKAMLKFMLNAEDNAIYVSHGMFIRYAYHLISGNYNIKPYDVINSKGFVFGNLDALEINTKSMEMKVFRYKDPINHKEQT